MIVEPLKLPGCLHLLSKTVRDSRGVFVKPFIAMEYQNLSLPTTFAEEYYTCSAQNVLRGMHYQTPPYEYAKLVSCCYGSVRDVIIDLRVGSPQFKAFQIIDLDDENGDVLYLPPGIAHGFLVLSEKAIVNYKVTSAHAPANDTGVRWDSFGMDWGVKAPIISIKDATLPKMEEIESLFTYQPEESRL